MKDSDVTARATGATPIGSADAVGFTPGPWEYVPSTVNHGPYVSGPWGGDICDCYTMSSLSDLAVCNGGTSKPVHFQADRADANARLIAAAPEMLDALKHMLGAIDSGAVDSKVVEGDDDSIPPHRWHDEWAAHTRTLIEKLGSAAA